MKELIKELSKKIDIDQKIQINGEIGFPIDVENLDLRDGLNFKTHECGCLVQIRPVADEYEKKTYLGIYLGDLNLYNDSAYYPDEKRLVIMSHKNPAIFVPELKKVIWGCESWWGPIETIEQLKQITDKEIQNIWYVKLLRESLEKKATNLNKSGTE